MFRYSYQVGTKVGKCQAVSTCTVLLPVPTVKVLVPGTVFFTLQPQPIVSATVGMRPVGGSTLASGALQTYIVKTTAVL